MSHHSSELINRALPISHRAPPSGKALKERLLLQMNEERMLEALAGLSGRNAASIAWLLEQDMIVPGGLLRAAIELDRELQTSRRPEKSIPIGFEVASSAEQRGKPQA